MSPSRRSAVPRLFAIGVLPLAVAAAVGAGRLADSPGDACPTAPSGTYVLAGTGEYAGYAYDAVQTLVFDRAGRATGRGTAVMRKTPAIVVPFEVREGTYRLTGDCHGTMRWFGHHPTLPIVDHVHSADFVVSGDGRRISLVYTDTQFPNGLPQPVETLLLSGERQ